MFVKNDSVPRYKNLPKSKSLFNWKSTHYTMVPLPAVGLQITMAAPARMAGGISTMALLVSFMFSILSAYVGFLGGLHHCGALATTNHHPALNSPPDCTVLNRTQATFTAEEHTAALAPLRAEVKLLKALLESKPNRVESAERTFGTDRSLPCSPCPEAKAIERSARSSDGCPPVVCPLAPAPKEQQPLRCPDAGAGKKGGGVGLVVEGKAGSKWKRLDGLDALAAHEILLPNFPPRKDNVPKGAILLAHGPPRPAV